MWFHRPPVRMSRVLLIICHTHTPMDRSSKYYKERFLWIWACVFMRVWTSIAALNSQSSPGPGPGAPAAVGSLGVASLALSSPLCPAELSLLAAAPNRTSRQCLSLGPDTQQTCFHKEQTTHHLTCGFAWVLKVHSQFMAITSTTFKGTICSTEC